jgi:4-amino-4-deoxy-L-arabinose transferase-like glycosyltransferase
LGFATMSDRSQTTPVPRSQRTAIGVLAGLSVATVVFHLAFGLYYATRTEHLVSQPTLRLQGEEYLRSFAGWGQLHESDAASYNYVATEILRTGVARTRSGALYLHAPAYAYFLAASYKLGGVRLLSVAVPNALLAGWTCWLLGMAAWRLAPRHNEWAACVAGGLFFVNLRIAMYVGYVSPTHLLLFLTALALWAATRGNTPTGVFGFAAALGAGILTQAAFFVTAAAGGVWAMARGCRDRHRAWVGAGVAVVAVAGLKVVINQLGGATTTDHLRQSARGVLWEANNPHYESMTLWSLWERRPGNPWTKWTASPAEAARHGQYLERAGNDKARAGWLWVRENPGHYARLCLVRLRTTLGPFTGQMSPRNRMISTVFWLLIFPAGYWALWRRRQEAVAQLGWLILAAVTVFETLVLADWYLRYRLPVDLLMMVFAAQTYANWIPTRTAPR